MALRDLMNWERPPERRLLQNFFGEELWPVKWTTLSFPAIDVMENDKSFKIRAEIMGMEPGDVEITVNDGYLTIQGEKREETKTGEEKDNYLRREISYGAFSRAVPLPETADIDRAGASFRGGILTIEIPKKAEAVGKTKKIEIRSGGAEPSRH